MNKFKIGDLVAISIPEHQNTYNSRAGVTNSDIGQIRAMSGNIIYIEWLTGTYPVEHGGRWTGKEQELKLVTDNRTFAVVVLKK